MMFLAEIKVIVQLYRLHKRIEIEFFDLWLSSPKEHFLIDTQNVTSPYLSHYLLRETGKCFRL